MQGARHHAPNDPRPVLGAGRSGSVYLDDDKEHGRLAAKVFGSESVVKLVQVVLLGAPNPYVWSEDAIQCALLRRRVLGPLLRFWFGDDVRVAPAIDVMKPLQGHLKAAGFDGMLWQAGLGNPVALNNFMLERVREGAGPETRRWVWIDLESGVPALVPMNPLSLLLFYLPKCFKHGRPLFAAALTSA
ncbi:MAG: hypothetical protein ACYS22_04515 [Planctomycetota bacterium]|jgi:hypothetical protein